MDHEEMKRVISAGKRRFEKRVNLQNGNFKFDPKLSYLFPYLRLAKARTKGNTKRHPVRGSKQFWSLVLKIGDFK